MSKKGIVLIAFLILAGVGKAIHRVATHTDDLGKLGLNLASEPSALIRKDIEAYKKLRVAAQDGDAEAMLKMSELTKSGRVTDPSEPSHAYWIFQSAKAGYSIAVESARQECSLRQDLRQTDKLFDQECASNFGPQNTSR